jgi:hypothetical protein
MDQLQTLCKACITVKCHGLHVCGLHHGLLTDQVIPAITARLQQPTNCIPYVDGLLHTLTIRTI